MIKKATKQRQTTRLEE